MKLITDKENINADEIPKDFTGIAEDKNGDRYWYVKGVLHREIKPAVIYANGTKFWYSEGKVHREDGPAIEYANGTKFWCIKGEIHRKNGPAKEYITGEKCWFLKDKQYTATEYQVELAKLSP